VVTRGSTTIYLIQSSAMTGMNVSEAVRDRLTVFPMASAVKSGIKLLDYLQFSTAYIVGSFLSTAVSTAQLFLTLMIVRNVS